MVPMMAAVAVRQNDERVAELLGLYEAAVEHYNHVSNFVANAWRKGQGTDDMFPKLEAARDEAQRAYRSYEEAYDAGRKDHKGR